MTKIIPNPDRYVDSNISFVNANPDKFMPYDEPSVANVTINDAFDLIRFAEDV